MKRLVVATVGLVFGVGLLWGCASMQTWPESERSAENKKVLIQEEIGDGLKTGALTPEQMAQEMAELSQESSEQGSMQQNMQSSLQQMGKQNAKGAKKSGQQASREARSLLEQLRMQQQQMMNQQMAEAAEKLRAAARELLKVSTSEEELIVGEGPEPRAMADHQQRLLEATRRVNEVVEELARSSMMVGTDFAGLLGQPIQSMKNAVASYERGSVTSGRTHATQALAQVNQAILELLAAEQRVNLRHGAIDAPAYAHLAPMKDELLLD